jgi:hypothetical protein
MAKVVSCDANANEMANGGDAEVTWSSIMAIPLGELHAILLHDMICEAVDMSLDALPLLPQCRE